MNLNYNHTLDWYYEGSISNKFINYLHSNKYTILKDNSSNIRKKGIDIIAETTEYIELIEVKGYPTEFYTNGKNKGAKKKTNPKLQAKHWIADALLSSIINYGEQKQQYAKPLRLSIVLPKKDRYIELILKIKEFLNDSKINIFIYTVDEKGNVFMYNNY